MNEGQVVLWLCPSQIVDVDQTAIRSRPATFAARKALSAWSIDTSTGMAGSSSARPKEAVTVRGI